MTLRSMEIFEAVARHMNMSRAADELHIAQPTISQAIREIENEYQVLLFNRIGKKLYITEEGLRLLDYTKQILSLTGAMDEEMNALALSPHFSVGATITIGQSVLAPGLRRFKAENPAVSVSVLVDNTAVIEENLLTGKLDFALVEGQIKHKDILSRPLIEDRLVLVCHKDHPLSARSRVCLKDVVGYPFLVREGGSGTRELFEKELERHRVHIHIAWTSHSFGSIISALMENLGVSVLSQLIARPYVQSGQLCQIELCDMELSRSFSLVHHKSKYLTQPMKALIEVFSGAEHG
jgi:DNA-binding transcriptional LysR family regulator